MDLEIISVSADNITPTGLNQSYTVEFFVRSTASTDVVSVCHWIVTNAALPADLSSFNATEGPNIKLSSFAGEFRDPNTPLLFFGTATYRKKSGGEDVEDNQDQEGAAIRFGSNTYEEVVTTALNEDGQEVAIMNSARERFADPVIEEDRRLVVFFEITYNWAEINPAIFSKYFNSVNRNAITFANVPVIARGAKMMSIRPTVRVVSTGTYDWRIEFEIEIKGRGRTYDRKILDQGHTYFEQLTGDEAALASDDGVPGAVKVGDSWFRRVRATSTNRETGETEPSPSPVLLDGQGGRLTDVSVGNEVYLTFRTKPEVDWSNLNLPRTIIGAVTGG